MSLRVSLQSEEFILQYDGDFFVHTLVSNTPHDFILLHLHDLQGAERVTLYWGNHPQFPKLIRGKGPEFFKTALGFAGKRLEKSVGKGKTTGEVLIAFGESAPGFPRVCHVLYDGLSKAERAALELTIASLRPA